MFGFSPMLSRAREIAYLTTSALKHWKDVCPAFFIIAHTSHAQPLPLTWHVLSKMSLLPTRTSVVVSNQLPRPPYSC